MLARKALAGTAAAPKTYVEDVFSTYLYTGNGSTQTITNNIDLSGEGGMVWIKNRTSGTTNNLVYDTLRGALYALRTNTVGTSDILFNSLTSFNSNGFSIGNRTGDGDSVSVNGNNYATWTFRKAEKFFDVVTYTGNGSARTIAHNLGSTPGFIVVKCTSAGSTDWAAYHRSLGATKAVILNGTDAAFTISSYWNDTEPTSSVFSVGTFGNVNTNGESYVAYLFAHDAGGFGDAGSDSIIKCGSFTTDGSGNATVTLGYEPQWVLVKISSTTGSWRLLDNMRGIPTGGNDAVLFANLNSEESSGSDVADLNATGFSVKGLTASADFIYIAIRRGPMKTPTTGTSVFAPTTYTGNGTSQTITSPGFAPDMLIGRVKASSTASVVDKLRGSLNYLYTSNSDGEVGSNSTSDVTAFTNTGFNVGADNRGNWNTSSGSEIVWTLKRAPGFFDVVAYAGTGSARTVTHNLGVTPELMLVKNRSEVYDWRVYSAETGGTKYLVLNSTAAAVTSSGAWNDTAPTSSVFTVGDSLATNKSGNNIVAYLFASVSGVSKVGSYTGNGSSVTVTTNFQPRFILVKRTDSTGNWIVSDSARGLVAGNDPYLLLNSSAAEDTDEDWVDITSTSFTVNETSASNANTNGGTYLYLAIA